VIGWHSYLQSKMIAFEDAEAYELNKEIFKLIHKRAYKASEEMAKEYGEPELLKGYGRRNSTLLSVAPTTSSAFILGQVSQSIEPWWSNCYVKDLAKIKTTIKNKELEKILELKGKNTREVWNSIRDRDGSVQHLDFLTDREKNIFKTFSEINQYAIIDQAADRQKFIDQGQSLNLMIHPKTSAKDINALYIDAWKQGIKSLYYQHSKSAAQELSRKIVCAGCEG
ncbi:ribonucleotide-diphosphate reductase subunit alpha, partial [Candidatus Gracilibacteria bacterium]